MKKLLCRRRGKDSLKQRIVTETLLCKHNVTGSAERVLPCSAGHFRNNILNQQHCHRGREF